MSDAAAARRGTPAQQSLAARGATPLPPRRGPGVPASRLSASRRGVARGVARGAHSRAGPATGPGPVWGGSESKGGRRSASAAHSSSRSEVGRGPRCTGSLLHVV